MADDREKARGMTGWAGCPAARAALSILRHRERGCPFPAGCRFWDGKADGCGIRFVSEAMAGELALMELNRLGRNDAHVARELGVSRATVSKWRRGRARVPERRACQLEAMLAGVKRRGAMDGDIVESRAYHKAEITAEVRRMLRLLAARGWNDSRVAWFCGVTRTAVFKWRHGVSVPTDRNFETLAEKYGEVSAEYKAGAK